MTTSESSQQLKRDSIKSLRVYPPIGIARVGNAKQEDQGFDDLYIVSPETVGGPSTMPDGKEAGDVTDFRGPSGAIKRQAARFRLYAEQTDGLIVEITADNVVSIEWTVRLANLKAGWYCFENAMDLKPPIAKSATKRNNSVQGNDRSALDITPRPRTIAGRSKQGIDSQFTDGAFCGSAVYLGELRTDAAGRLLVLGGMGSSAPKVAGTKPKTFANNDGWHDDTADGPVRATVRFADGTTLDAEPGYVVVTPPNFAPGLRGLVTMDDAVRETFYEQRWLERPMTTSFTEHIWPIFERLSNLQWVNHGHFIVAGVGSPLDPRDPVVFARMRDASPDGKPWRELVRSLFRSVQEAEVPDNGKLAQVYSDYFGEVGTGLESVGLALVPTMLEHLDRWQDGRFTDDWQGEPRVPKFDDLSPSAQVEQLERASLHDCLGGPFHPGIELTFTMRLATVWARPYRLKVLPDDAPARQNFGPLLTPAVCLSSGGPFDGVAAGALTRFMGVPWQTDEASCNSAADYSPSTFLSMPTYWGARVPDQVLSAESARFAEVAAKAGRSMQSIKHLATRSDWLRDVRGRGYLDRIENMIKEWHELGMVLPLAGAEQVAAGCVRCEQGRSDVMAGHDPKVDLVAKIETLDQPTLALKSHAPTISEREPAPERAVPRRRYRRGEV